MKKTTRYLSALALAAGLGSMSAMATPDDSPSVQAQFGFKLPPYCLSGDPNARCYNTERNWLMIELAKYFIGPPELD